MEIIIQEYNNNQVLFKSEYGIGIAKWKGDTSIITFQNYYVELDIHGKLVFGKDVNLSNATSTKINKEENVCIIIGKIESVETDDIDEVDEGDLITIRIGDSIFMCTIDGVRGLVEEFVEIRTSNLELTPYSIY